MRSVEWSSIVEKLWKNWQCKQIMPTLTTWSYSAKICKIWKSLTPQEAELRIDFILFADSKQPRSLAQYQHNCHVGSAEDHGVETWFNQSGQLGDSDNQGGSCSTACGLFPLSVLMILHVDLRYSSLIRPWCCEQEVVIFLCSHG